MTPCREKNSTYDVGLKAFDKGKMILLNLFANKMEYYLIYVRSF